MTHHFIGHNKTRLTASPSRHFVACAIAVLCLSLIGGAALARAGLARHAAWHFAEARV